jgi:hypothetical protein
MILFTNSGIRNDFSWPNLNGNKRLGHKRDVFSGKAFCINLLIGIFLREFHHHAPCRSDNLSSQKNIFQPERLACASAAGTGDLLPLFSVICEVHFEQQKQIVDQHHQLKGRFISPK